MKIGLFSDIHLEHREPEEAAEILRRIAESAKGVDVLVNAGDTHDEFDVQYLVAQACINVLPLTPMPGYIAVQGNHDYYYGEWRDDEVEMSMHGNATTFMSGTMWTDFGSDPIAEFNANMCIADFKYIGGVSSSAMKEQFEKFRKAVEKVKPDVVVTHFAPSPDSITDQWQGHPLNNYFCPDMLSQLDHWPQLWLHGHIHQPVDYVVDKKQHYPHWDKKCRVVANPLGYPGETYKSVGQYAVKWIEI